MILNYAKSNDKKISCAEAIECVGHRYDYNAKKRVRHALAILTNEGKLIRIKFGHYELPDF